MDRSMSSPGAPRTATSDAGERLPGPPDPWQPSTMPPVRSGPPFAMTEMIAAEPDLAVRIVERLGAPGGAAERVADAVRRAVDAHEPVLVTGCGTSEHGALAIAEQLAEALRATGRDASGVRAEQALELALDPPSRGLVIAVSHEGGSAATNRALETSAGAGARTAVVTAAADSPAARLAETALVLDTAEIDQSWCHTVAYVSAIVAGAVVAASVGGRHCDPDALRRLLAGPQSRPEVADVEAAATALASVERLVVVASGADRTAGRELVLKVEEGAALPAAYRDLETFLHGHLAGVNDRTGLVAVLVDRRAARERAGRGAQLLAAARELEMPAVGIVGRVAAEIGAAELTPAGRILVADEPALAASTAALIGTAVPLQLLTERLARARGRNPDAIGRDQPAYRAAAAAAESA